MKTTVFHSAWNEYEPAIDRLMTRERAAKLLRAWRRNSRKKTNNPLWVCKRLGPHTYFVKISERDKESHTLIVG
jgi:hypothetical protein